MKFLFAFLCVFIAQAADPLQPSIGGKQLIVSSNGYAGILTIRTQLVVSSPNLTYETDIAVTSNGQFTITPDTLDGTAILVINPDVPHTTGTLVELKDGAGNSVFRSFADGNAEIPGTFSAIELVLTDGGVNSTAVLSPGVADGALPYSLGTVNSHTTGNLFALSNLNTLEFYVAHNAGQDGDTNKFFRADGTFGSSLATDCAVASGPDIDPTGLTDSTAGFNRVIAEATSKGFGRICIPPGRFGVNLLITNDNVVIVGCGTRDVNSNTNIVLFPWDVTKFVIQVGNDSGIINGFGLRDIALYGLRGATNSLGCLYFAGGAYHGDVSFVQFLGGADTVKFKAGVTWPSTLNALSHCALWEGTNSTIVVDDTRTGAGYCTGNKLVNSSVNGFNTGGQAIRVIKGRLNMEGVYLDGNDGFSILSDHGGILSCVNCDLENASGQSAILLTVDWRGESYTLRDPSVFLNGGTRVQGQVAWLDGVGPSYNTNITQIPTGGGLEWILPRALLSKPWVATPMKFGTILNPTDGVYEFDMAGTNGPFYFQRADGGTATWTDRTLESRKYVDLGNDNTFLEYDFPGLTSSNANIYFFRGTATTGNRLLSIFRGDGSADTQTQLNAYGSSFINALTGFLGVGKNNPTATLDVGGTVKLGNPLMLEISATDVIPYGQISFFTDNTWMIGGDSNYRPSIVNVGTSVKVGGGSTSAGFLDLDSTNSTYTIVQTVDASGNYKLDYGTTNMLTVLNGSAAGNDGSTTKFLSAAGSFTSLTNYVTIALSNPNTALTTGNTNFWVAPEAITIKSVTAYLLVPSSSGSVTLELKKNGTTILSSAATLTSGTTNATASVSVTSGSANDRYAGEVTGAGTTAYGAQLKIGYTAP